MVEEKQIKNFIGIFKNAYTKEFCENVIKQYEDMVDSGYGQTRFELENVSRTIKDDTQIFANDIDYIPLRNSKKEFNETFWGQIFPVYEQEYSVLKDSGRHTNYIFKIQKTKIGGGYHVWHYESSNRDISNRLLTWMVGPWFK